MKIKLHLTLTLFLFTIALHAQISISSFSPLSGPVGTSVIISGSNFNIIPTNNIVKFNGVTATVTSSTSKIITATVPTGARSGTISVTVEGNTATSANFFGVDVKACGVSFLDPGGNSNYLNNQSYAQTFLPVSSSEKVTVSFSSFDLELDNDFLYVYNGPSTSSPLLAQLTGTTLPSNITSSAEGGELTFMFNSDQSVTRSGWAASITCGVPPTVSSFNPISGQVGTSVTISGTNFSTIPTNNVVKFNGVLATVIASTRTSITAVVPTGATSGAITVALASNTAISSTNFTVVLPPPNITAFSPAMGAIGTSITITGTNFDTLTGNTIVTLNGQEADITSITSSSITIKVPSDATTGKIGVTVAGQVTTSSTDFKVLTIPGEWVEKNNGIYASNRVNALVVNGNYLYAGTFNGVFLSTNTGNSWTAVNTGLTDTYILSLAVNGGNLYAGTYNGVFRSTNKGLSWTPVNTGLTNITIQSLAVSGSNLYAGTGGGGGFSFH
jgi:hypothetical protein